MPATGNVPLIGVLPLWDETRDSYWMLPGYFQGIRAAGGMPVMLPLVSTSEDIRVLASSFDGFLFTGGQDISPGIYHQENTACGALAPERDRLETALLEQALELDLPIFGICRGIQFINAALGGTLWQDLPSQFSDESPVLHSSPAGEPIARHPVAVFGALADLLGVAELEVNSYHHQGIRTLAPGLDAMAQAPDSLIEAVRLPDARFCWAVQWHPELALEDPAAQQLFTAFVEACGGFLENI